MENNTRNDMTHAANARILFRVLTGFMCKTTNFAIVKLTFNSNKKALASHIQQNSFFINIFHIFSLSSMSSNMFFQ